MVFQWQTVGFLNYECYFNLKVFFWGKVVVRFGWELLTCSSDLLLIAGDTKQ